MEPRLHIWMASHQCMIQCMMIGRRLSSQADTGRALLHTAHCVIGSSFSGRDPFYGSIEDAHWARCPFCVSAHRAPVDSTLPVPLALSTTYPIRYSHSHYCMNSVAHFIEIRTTSANAGMTDRSFLILVLCIKPRPAYTSAIIQIFPGQRGLFLFLHWHPAHTSPML